MTDQDAPPYAVGYKRPPAATRFQAGRSGNPKGRRKGSKNFATVIQNELQARIPVTENGRRRKISKREAVAKQLVNKAAAGDSKALPLLLNEIRAHELANPAAATGPESKPLSSEDLSKMSTEDLVDLYRSMVSRSM